jgi:hypothetical protein
MQAERARVEQGGGNPHEATARARKAARLTDVLVRAIDATPGFPLTPANIHRLCAGESTASFRRDFEELAGVRPSSQITWAVVEGLLDEHYFSSSSANVVHLADRR